MGFRLAMSVIDVDDHDGTPRADVQSVRNFRFPFFIFFKTSR